MRLSGDRVKDPSILTRNEGRTRTYVQLFQGAFEVTVSQLGKQTVILMGFLPLNRDVRVAAVGLQQVVHHLF